MTGVWDFDPDLWRWTATMEESVGPAGLASAWLSPGIRVDVDAWSGSLARVIAEASAATGDLDHGDRDALAVVVETGPAADRVVVPSAATAAAVSRLVRIEESAKVADAFGEAVEPWETEAADLRRNLGLVGGSVRGATPSTDPDGFEQRRARSIERLAARSFDLGAVPAEGGPVAIDPSAVLAGILELVDGAFVSWSPPTTLRVEVPVRRDVYAPEVGRLACVVRDGSEVIAMQTLAVGLGRDGEPVAIADLTVSSSREPRALELLVTADPRRLPSKDLTALRAAIHLARNAATAHRLGAGDLADRLMGRWRVRSIEAGRSTTYEGEVPVEPPFLGELLR